MEKISSHYSGSDTFTTSFNSDGRPISQQPVGQIAKKPVSQSAGNAGVSEYKLTHKLPKDLKSSLPTIEEIDREFAGLKEGKDKK